MALTALAAVSLTAACNPAGSVQSGNNSPGVLANPAPPPSTFSLAITPAAGTKNLPVSSEIGIALRGGQITEVALTKSGTPTKIQGSIRDDGTSWIPAAPLSFSSTYDVAVTGRSADGSRTDTKTTSFSTMGDPERTTTTGLYLFNGETVGVGMPVVLEFDEAVPEASRANVQRRLFVTSNPPQPGAWYWPSGNQAWYRPPNYWLPGTTLTVRAGLRGAPVGEGRYGDADRLATVTVGNKVFMDVDNETKQMNVYVDNQLVKTMPVSLGKASTPSSSGHMVTMTHDYTTTFRTSQYVVDVNYAMRLTWGGEYIHAAPWSVRDQGVRNVSHGCINVATGNARWLYDSTHIGDPVVVRGTEVPLSNGNGWTAWNIPWSEYVKGSALPVDPQLAAVVSTPESVSASATTPPPPPPAATTTPGPSEIGTTLPISRRAYLRPL